MSIHPADLSPVVGTGHERWFDGDDVTSFLGPAQTRRAQVGLERANQGPANWGPQAMSKALAIAFAAHLSQLRRSTSPHLVVTAASRPSAVAGAVLIPHLLTVTGGLPGDLGLRGDTAETAVWERMPVDAVRDWLARPLNHADRRFFDDHVPDLLTLKGAVRRRTLPSTSATRRLFGLLAEGRYLSIRLVYQHPALFRALIRDLPPVTEESPL